MGLMSIFTTAGSADVVSRFRAKSFVATIRFAMVLGLSRQNSQLFRRQVVRSSCFAFIPATSESARKRAAGIG